MSTDDHGLREEVAGIVGRGALPRDAIRAELERRQVELPAGRSGHPRLDHLDGLDQLIALDMTFAEVTDGVVHVPSLVEGTSWTVWVDDDEAARGFLRMHPHLDPLGWWLIDDEVSVVDADGDELGVLSTTSHRIAEQDIDVVLGPDGWLDGVRGGWATVTVRDGALHLTPCEVPPAATEAQMNAVRAAFELAQDTTTVHQFETDEQLDLVHATADQVIHEALLADRDAFVEAPIPRLPALYEAAELETEGTTVAGTGFDWQAFRSWQHRKRLSSRYGLDERQAELLIVLLGGCLTVVGNGVESLGADDSERDAVVSVMAGIVEQGAVATAFWGELDARGVPGDDRRRFAEVLVSRWEDAAGGGMPPGMAWLWSAVLDRCGETDRAVAVLDGHADMAGEYRPALIARAGFAADRSDAVGARELLRRADLIDADAEELAEQPEHVRLLVDEVQAFGASRPRSTARRNDPCPCGSGKKYKACHLGRELHGIDDRAAWLFLKAQRFVRARHRWMAARYAEVMALSAGVDQLFGSLVDGPFVDDLVLHEDAVFREFMDARASLLPHDEVELAEAWLDASRAVFRIDQVDGGSLDLEDLGSGGHMTVVNADPSGRARRGSLIVGRPLPVGPTYRSFSGFVPVTDNGLDELIDAFAERDGDGVAEAIGSRLAI